MISRHIGPVSIRDGVPQCRQGAARAIMFGDMTEWLALDGTRAAFVECSKSLSINGVPVRLVGV